MNDQPMTLAELVRRHQDTTGDSYADIAKKSGMSKAKVGQLAHPNYEGRPRQDTLEKLARGLNVPMRVVMRAAFHDMQAVTDNPEADATDDRVMLLASRIAGLPPETFRLLEVVIDSLAADAVAQRGR